MILLGKTALFQNQIVVDFWPHSYRGDHPLLIKNSQTSRHEPAFSAPSRKTATRKKDVQPNLGLIGQTQPGKIEFGDQHVAPIVQRWDRGNTKMKVVTVKTATALIGLVTLGTGIASAQSGNAAGDGSMVLSLLPFVIISAILAFGNYFLAVKSGRSGILYVILAFIPLVGFIATGYLIYTSLYRALDQKRAQPDGAPRG